MTDRLSGFLHGLALSTVLMPAESIRMVHERSQEWLDGWFDGAMTTCCAIGAGAVGVVVWAIVTSR
jgi:hypothetical protein